jgi:hypothetical protein
MGGANQRDGPLAYLHTDIGGGYTRVPAQLIPNLALKLLVGLDGDHGGHSYRCVRLFQERSS